jgi:hypothetical protein
MQKEILEKPNSDRILRWPVENKPYLLLWGCTRNSIHSYELLRNQWILQTRRQARIEIKHRRAQPILEDLKITEKTLVCVVHAGNVWEMRCLYGQMHKPVHSRESGSESPDLPNWSLRHSYDKVTTRMVICEKLQVGWSRNSKWHWIDVKKAHTLVCRL